MRKKWLVRAAVVIGVFVASLLVATPAMAMWDWCDCDPVLNIGGHTVSLDAALQGDPKEIRGNIAFTVTVPRGTQINVVYCEPNATVKINYNNSYNSNYNDNNNSTSNCNDNNSWGSFRQSPCSIPVSVSVDINTKTVYNTRLTVGLDGKQIAQVMGTTRHDLEYSFTVK